MFFTNPHDVPGIGTRLNTQESQVWWGKEEHQLYTNLLILSSAVDAGNTPTTLLRAGLLLGKITATGKLKEWNPAGTDGSQVINCVLMNGIDMLTGTTASDRWTGYGLCKGNLKAGSLIIPGNASAGILGDAYEMEVRAQLGGRFIFDDDYSGVDFGGLETIRRLIAATATLVAAETDTLIVGTFAGAMTVTLPTPRLGLRYRFFNAVDQNFTIAAAAAGQLITFNDLAADSVAFSTAGNKIGASCEVIGVLNGAGTAQFAVIPSGANTMTVV